MMTGHDIVGLGCAAIDEILTVENYPDEDGKAPIIGRRRRVGGITAAALLAASRWGARCGYGGVLGHDADSLEVLAAFEAERVDYSICQRRPDARPIRSTIIVGRQSHSRTVLYDLSGAYGAQVDWPADEVIARAGVLMIDHFGVEGMLRACQIAREAGVPIVADFESDQRAEFPDLLALVDHLVVSMDFGAQLTETLDPPSMVNRLCETVREAVVVTGGSAGCWFRSVKDPTSVDGPLIEKRSDGVCHLPALQVAPVDTTGCGDVFHGVYAATLVEGKSLVERVSAAAFAAALQAAGGGTVFPTFTRPEVERLLATEQRRASLP